MCVWTWDAAVVGCPYLHKYTCDGSGCVTEYVWGTCVDLSPGYVSDCRSLAEVDRINPLKCWVCVYNREFSGVWLPISSQILTRWQWLCDRIRVRYLFGVESRICLWLPEFGGSWEHKTTEMLSRCVYMWHLADFGWPHLHKYTCDGRGCVTDYVWGTCVELIPG